MATNSEQLQTHYITEQALWIEQVGLKEGNLVRVMCSAEHNQAGWDAEWRSEMDEHVGGTYRVREIGEDGDLAAGITLTVEVGRTWLFPFFVLIKIEEDNHISDEQKL